MSYPIGRAARANFPPAIRQDLQAEKELNGTLIGVERRDEDWGLITGEVAVLILRESQTRVLIEVPILDGSLIHQLTGDPPQPGQLIAVRCIGIAEPGITVSRESVSFKVIRDRAEPVLDMEGSDEDVVTTRT